MDAEIYESGWLRFQALLTVSYDCYVCMSFFTGLPIDAKNILAKNDLIDRKFNYKNDNFKPQYKIINIKL